MAENVRDLFLFSDDARRRAGLILIAYSDADRNLTERLGRVICVEWNPDSDMVFAISPQFTVGVLNSEGDLLDWILCPVCYQEGFAAELKANAQECCRNFITAEFKKFKTA